MKRTDLVATVAASAVAARLPEDITLRLIEAVSNPRVTEVAHTVWRTESGCECPMMLAGLYGPFSADWLDSRLSRGIGAKFVAVFDRQTSHVPGEVIEVEE